MSARFAYRLGVSDGFIIYIVGGWRIGKKKFKARVFGVATGRQRLLPRPGDYLAVKTTRGSDRLAEFKKVTPNRDARTFAAKVTLDRRSPTHPLILRSELENPRPSLKPETTCNRLNGCLCPSPHPRGNSKEGDR